MSQPGPTDLLTAAIATATSTLARVEPAALGRPTPCSEWTLRDLLQHMAGRAVLSERAARGIAVTTFPETSADLLGGRPAETLADLRSLAATRAVTLLTATEDVDHSAAAVLAQVLVEDGPSAP